jgi:hypothetical protein
VAISFERGAKRIHGLDVVKVGEGVWRHSLGFGLVIILDICQDGYFPVRFHAISWGLFSLRLKSLGHFFSFY